VVEKTVSEIVDTLRKRLDIPVIGVGPLIGKSPAWGQKILDGTICPTPSDADHLARELHAREEERLALLEVVGRRKLVSAGLTREVIDEILGVLEKIYREQGCPHS